MSNININDLPRSQQILDNDLFIIQTDNGTQTITFEDLNAVQRDAENNVTLIGKLNVAKNTALSGTTFCDVISTNRIKTIYAAASSYTGYDNTVVLRGEVKILDSSAVTPTTFGYRGANDTTLYRQAAQTLKTDNTFIVGQNLQVNGTSYLGDNNADAVFVNAGNIRLTNCTDPAQCVQFGDSFNLNTANVYISAGNILRTDNNLSVGGNVDVYGDINALGTSTYNILSATTIRISSGTILVNALSAGLADIRTLKNISNDNRLLSIYDANNLKNFELRVDGKQVDLYVMNLTGGATGNPFNQDDEFYKVQTTMYNVSAARPNNPFRGQMFFDQTYNQPIWWDGTKWVAPVNGTTNGIVNWGQI